MSAPEDHFKREDMPHHLSGCERLTRPHPVYLRDAHKGQGDECWVPCAKGDPGAVLFIPANY